MLTNISVVCQHCGCRRIAFGLHINRSGAKTVIARCSNCGYNPIKNKPFYSVKDFDIETMPVLMDDRPDSEPCAVCKEKRGSQYHHFAPRHLFGTECEDWPGAWLCKKHHDQWHDIVTPNMRKARQ
jgi:hypothetical protein